MSQAPLQSEGFYRRHTGLISENTTKMANIREHFILHGKERTSRINEVNTRKVVFMGNRLGSDVFFHGHWVITTTFDGCIIGHKQAFTTVNHAYPSHNTCRMSASIVQLERCKWREFQKCCTGVDDLFNSLAGQKFAPAAMTVDVFASTTH